jgi:hypothetical protein
MADGFWVMRDEIWVMRYGLWVMGYELLKWAESEVVFKYYMTATS